MNQPHAPTLGARLSRPCELSTIKPNLLALIEKGKHLRQLTSIQFEFYQQLCEAWMFYRPSQPSCSQAEIDGLIDAIAEFRVSEVA